MTRKRADGSAGLISRALGRISTALLSALLLVASAHTAGAAGVVGTGTAASCTDAALNVALAGGGLVTFTCGGAATITVTSTQAINADTTIDGGSLITISGGNSVGVFSVNAGVNFTVQNLTIANGNSGIGGGGIHNDGTLTVTNSTFIENTANGELGGGGGIFNAASGTLTVTNTTFTSNRAPNGGGIGGGGIGNDSGTLTVTNSTFTDNSAPVGGGIGGSADNSPMTVTNTTFSGNSAAFGGGIFIADSNSTLTVANTTFSGNSASVNGGGIFNAGTLTVTNATFSGNSASVNVHGGGGLHSAFGPLTVINTIIANSSAGNCDGTVIDGGHNIADDGSCGFSGTSFSNTHPMLAALANNGGPTETIALQAGSPAINAGNESVCAAPPVNNLDQRGYVRPGAGATSCSIGAYEYNAQGPSTPTSTTTGTPTPTPTLGPSPTPGPCYGDCDSNGRVTVDELVKGVNIALGDALLSTCPDFDCNGNGHVTVNCLVKAVNAALNGCSGPP